MKRFALLLTCAVMLAGSGCCCWPGMYGNACGYGAGYSPAPAMYAPGGCPGGACGAAIYPQQAAYVTGAATTAFTPVATTAVLEPMPVY